MRNCSRPIYQMHFWGELKMHFLLSLLLYCCLILQALLLLLGVLLWLFISYLPDVFFCKSTAKSSRKLMRVIFLTYMALLGGNLLRQITSSFPLSCFLAAAVGSRHIEAWHQGQAKCAHYCTHAMQSSSDPWEGKQQTQGSVWGLVPASGGLPVLCTLPQHCWAGPVTVTESQNTPSWNQWITES